MNNKRVVVKVAPSEERSGNGVFATKTILSGRPVCYYDGDVITLGDFKRLNTDQEFIRRDLCEYMQEISGRRFVIGYKEPRCVLGVAQLVNDYCVPEYIGNLESYRQVTSTQVNVDEVQNVINNTQVYVKQSCAGSNVHAVMNTIDDKLWFLTKRRVKAGTELTYHYGAQYWLKQAWRKTGHPVFQIALAVGKST